MIERSNCYTTNGTDFHATLEEAKIAALATVFGSLEKGPTEPQLIARFAYVHGPELLEILTVKEKGRPRKDAATRKPRKAKLATAPMPLGEKGAA